MERQQHGPPSGLSASWKPRSWGTEALQTELESAIRRCEVAEARLCAAETTIQKQKLGFKRAVEDMAAEIIRLKADAELGALVCASAQGHESMTSF